MIIRGRHFHSEQIMDFRCEDGFLVEAQPAGNGTPDLGSAEHWVVPGLVDLQVNGYRGIDYCSADVTPEQIESATRALADAGVTAYCPTLITNSHSAIVNGLRAIAGACRAGGAAARRIIGIHLEGPFISPETGPRGTHPLEYVRPPDWEEFLSLQEAAENRICMVTLAPELPGAIDFIRRASAAGIIVGIGHHAASSDQIRAAIAAGAGISTHLGNGAHARLPRHPNYIWDQLASDELAASIVVDGHHLPPSVVKTFFRAKGAGRLILVSDVVWLAGLEPGRYRFAGQDVDLCADGCVRLAGTSFLAGSALKLVDALSNMMAFAGASLSEAVRMAATNPAQLVRAAGRGLLTPGGPADLCLLSKQDGASAFALDATIVGGEIAYRAL